MKNVFEQNTTVFKDLIQKVYDGLIKNKNKKFRIISHE